MFPKYIAKIIKFQKFFKIANLFKPLYHQWFLKLNHHF